MKSMAKIAVKFAVKHKISLGQWVTSKSGQLDGYYHIVDHENGCSTLGGQRVSAVSLKPTGKSAVIMMKKHLRK